MGAQGVIARFVRRITLRVAFGVERQACIIERSLFMLDWIENPQLRMECQAGLNKGEARHTLARAVFAHFPRHTLAR